MDLRVLFIEDSVDDTQLVLRHLRQAGIEVLWQRVETEASLREALAGERWDLALVDYNLPGFGGSHALEVLAEAAPDLPAITVSGAISEDTAVATLTAGAVDYVLKDNLTRLAPAVERAVEGAELRRRQRRFREQARQSQFAVDHASQAILYVSEDGVLLYVNEAAERLGGLPRDEAVGREIWDWIPEVDRRRWDELRAAAAERPIVDFETVVRHAGGEDRVVKATIDLLERDGGAFVIIYARDITEQRLAEERADETEARYRRLTDNAPDIIFRYDLLPLPALTYINPAVEAITGYTPQECCADPQLMLTMIHPDDAPLMAGPLQSLKPPDEPMLLRWIGKDGVTRWMESRVVPVLDAGGQLVAVEGITRDVSQRVRAEEALRRSEQAHRALVEGLPDVIMRFDRDGRHLFVSENVRDSVDLEAAHFIGKNHRELGFPEEQCRLWEEAIGGVFESGDAFDAEFSLEGKRGETFFDWRLVPERDARGAVRSVMSISRDITAQRRAEREYRTLFREMRDGFALHEIVCDAEGRPVDYRFVSVNPAFERMTGLAAQDIEGRTVLEVLPGTEPLWIETYGRVALTGEPATFEDYSAELERHFSVSAFRPAPGHFACVVTDVTERKRIEDALRESETHFRAFFEQASIGMATTSLAKGWLETNDALCAMLGYSRTELHRTTWAELTHPDDLAADEAKFERLVAGEIDGYALDKRFLRKDGGIVHTHLTVRAVRDPGGDRGYLAAVLEDITERHEAQESVRSHAERLRRTLEGTVLAMSHVVETRDPYTAGHERRVAELAVAIAAEMGVTGDQLDGLRLAGLIHDIGKIAIPAEILARPGRLSAVEYHLIKQHAQSGYDILEAIEFDQPVARIVLQHHERLDGSGYPQGLTGEDILPEARILAVADVVEAMSSHRPYRAALGMEPALAEIRENAGVKYDAEVAAACLRVVEEQGFAFTE